MNNFNIRKDLPSIKVDMELIKHLEQYILDNIPEILEIDKQLIKDNYSILIVDSLGSGSFNSISDFPLSSFQNGTKKIKLGFRVYDQFSYSIDVSFDYDSYGSQIDISLRTNNPREKAQGIYSGLMDYINQSTTYNYLFHKFYTPMIGGGGIAAILYVTIQALKKNYLLASLIFLASILAIIYAYYCPRLKPYSEFMTNRQKRNNKIFSFFAWGTISYLVFVLGFGLLKDFIIQ